MATWPWQVHLDRKVCLAGTYSAPNTSWTLGFTDNTLNAIVLSNEFGAPGTVLTPDSNSAGTVTIAGDYSAGCVLIGRLYAMSVELSRFFRRNNRGVADINDWVQVQKVVAAYHNSGPFTLRAAMTNRTDRTKTFTQSPGSLSAAYATLEAWFNGRAEDLTVYIESTNPKPVIVSSLKFLTMNSPGH